MSAPIEGEMSCKIFPRFLWEIPYFFDMPPQPDYVLESPGFSFADATWCLRMLPNCERGNEGPGCIEIHLVRFHSHVQQKIALNVGIFSTLGERFQNSGVWSFPGVRDASHYGASHMRVCLFPRQIIEGGRDQLVPGGTMSVYCDVRQWQSSGVGVLKTELGASKRKAEEQEVARMKLLRSDLKQLLESGQESGDLCIVVSGREFRAHRCILGARSRVFDAMFNHDMQEKKTGRVVIDDLDPGCFQLFLEHVYTGHVEALSDENAFGLYTAADKYDFQALKSDCVEHMKRTLSVDSFCDAVTLALNYHEEELKDLAVEFFKKNLANIIHTVKWQTFLCDNGTLANEILKTAFVP